MPHVTVDVRKDFPGRVLNLLTRRVRERGQGYVKYNIRCLATVSLEVVVVGA